MENAELKQSLRSLVTNIIDNKTEPAQTDFHKYISDKTNNVLVNTRIQDHLEITQK